MKPFILPITGPFRWGRGIVTEHYRLSITFIAAMGLVFAASSSSWAADAGGQLILSDAVAVALEKNPEIHSARQRVQVASARAKQAPYLEDPEIAFQLGAIPFSTPTNLNNADTNSIGIRQKLPFFGKLGLKEQIAQQEIKVAEQELRAKEREVISMVKMAYADLFMAERVLEIVREQLEIMRTIIGATEARYRVGRVTQQDVFKAQLEQSELLNQLIVAEEEVGVAVVKLNTAMHRPPRTPINLPAELVPKENTLTAADLDEVALANRPELQGMEREIERAERARELAERNRKYPDFMVGWDYMRMPTEMKKDRYGAMVNITIPFSPWTAGRHAYEVEESLAEIRAARASRDAARNLTLRQVGESQSKVRAAQRSVQLYREGLLSQAELSFRSALAAYQSGRVEFINLLDAQRALRDARMGYYKATVSLVQNLAELERAVGRDLH